MADILHPLITHQGVGISFVGTYYVEAAFVKPGKNKKDFTELTLRDKSGSRICRYWGIIAGVKKGCFVHVEAAVEDYMGAPSIVVNRVEVKDAPSDTSNYIAACDDLDKYVERIAVSREWLKQVESGCPGSIVGKIVEDIYGNDDFNNRFPTAPSGVKPFYGRQGGLLANTARVVEQCGNIAGSYSLRPDEKLILTAAALLFRVGAVEVYEFRDCMPMETDKGVLLGINNMTMNKLFISVRKVWAEETKANRAIDSDGVFRLMHAVSAYAGNLLRPMTKESIILAAAYRMDNELVEAIEFMENDTNIADKFTAYDPAFGRRYYVGKRQ
jgi:hypothetical protein